MEKTVKQTNQLDLFAQMVRASEQGFNHALSTSIKFSAFNLFFKIFKSTNRNLMNQVRNVIRDDLSKILSQNEGFNIEIFITENSPNEKGRKLLQVCYNIGIFILKKKLNFRSVFKLISNANFRSEIYNFYLNSVNSTVIKILKS